jgi:hypothetical protein
MDDQANPSCWGLTTKVVAGIAVLMLLAWLIGGSESAAVMATAG